MISIIFLCHNNPHIRLCVDAAYDMIEDGDEIIVVDDNSDDATQEVLEALRVHKPIKLLRSIKNGNRSHNRNLGAKAAINDILLFADGDMVLCPKALQAVRTAHAKGEAVAHVGLKHNIRYSDLHCELFSGVSYERYIEMLLTEDGRARLMDNPLFNDTSMEDFKNTDLARYFWLHFYAGACAIQRGIFESVGGYDESFVTWGGEDVDLGYRISKKGSIGFINQFSSIHIPHPKDVITQEMSGNKNMLKMRSKYNRWEFEVLYAFTSALDVFGSFHRIINQMRMINSPPMNITLAPNTIAAYPVSAKHPNGLLIHDKQYHESLCLALDYPDDRFDTAYVADTMFIYPSVITARVLQELCRVSGRVLILPTGETTRVDWKGISFSALGKSNSRLFYRSNGIMDFRFERNRHGIEVEPVIQMQMLPIERSSRRKPMLAAV